MKKMVMTAFDLRELSRNELEQVAIAVRDGNSIDVQGGVALYNEYIESNEYNDELSFLEILEWYVDEKMVNDYVLLRVHDGDICHVEIEYPAVKPFIMDEGLTLPDFNEQMLIIHRKSTKEEIIAFLESRYVREQGKEGKRQKSLSLVQKQGEHVAEALIQIIMNRFGNKTFL